MIPSKETKLKITTKKIIPWGYWTFNVCKEMALKYCSKMEFRQKCQGAYAIALRHRWIEEICKHMVPLRKPNGYWSKDRCATEALKYNKRIEYEKNSPVSYNAATRHKWTDEICKHMIRAGNRFNKCVYSYEFPDNFVYVGLTYSLENRQKGRDLDPSDQVTKHISETGLIPIRKQLTDYIAVDDAIKTEDSYVKKYRRDGWDILNVAKTGAIGGRYAQWTYQLPLH